MSDLAEDIGNAIHYLLKNPSILPGFRDQFRPQERNAAAVARNINAAFLIGLTGKRLSHPAKGYLLSMSGDNQWGSSARFYLQVLDYIEEELAAPGLEDLYSTASELARFLGTFPEISEAKTLEKFWDLFFPEGAKLVKGREKELEETRSRRKILVRTPGACSLDQPHEQMLFTSNVLLTVPLEKDTESLSMEPGIKDKLKSAVSQDQAYWYDHPIPVGIETGKNEAVYGLNALDQALRFEVERGNVPAESRVPILLSISTTHHGLQALARDYLALELEKAGGIDFLSIYSATETDVRKLTDTVLLPAAHRFFPDRDTQPLAEVFGVDGEYGRHFSFLKASAAFWQLLIDSRVKATFKIDLDQVFPQEELVSETGRSAFEHLSDPLWGAVGMDNDGREIELGMLAGALVNEADISKGLFTPDVNWPKDLSNPDQWIFASAWPQVLSTEAEMMTRYGDDDLDGRNSCLQRIHVTGGTTGIRIDCLRRHRPFTPGWIGRAEDQAYLLSVLFPERGPALRYLHASGFFMRHDKEAFAAEAMKAARTGKLVGDYVRILAFTSYARALPWGVDAIKKVVDPFTGCFISRFPITVSCLRMALTAAGMFASGSDTGDEDGIEMVRVGSERLGKAIEDFHDESTILDKLQREKDGWDLYYDVLDELEKALRGGDRFAESLREKARQLVEGWRV